MWLRKEEERVCVFASCTWRGLAQCAHTYSLYTAMEVNMGLLPFFLCAMLVRVAVSR